MSGITLAQAQAQLDALMAATQSNSLSVQYGERRVQYRSMTEIIEAIKFWESKVATLSRIAAGRNGLSIRLASFQ
ncbi:MAG: hypothetical protein KA179_12630 [Sulfuritalea sp.]|nr:hypothetical protein [Sulfuritalea sp.]